MKKLIAMTLTIAMLLGLLTIPASAITPTVNMDKLRENAEAYNKNAVKAAANAAEKGELPGNVTVIVDDEDDNTETAAEETVNENDDPVEETVNEFDEEIVEPETTEEAETDNELAAEIVAPETTVEAEEDAAEGESESDTEEDYHPAVSYKEWNWEDIWSRWKCWWK